MTRPSPTARPAPQTGIAVVGTGPVGLATALSLARSGIAVTLVGPAPDGRDPRTAALFTASLNLLKTLSVWEDVRAASAPIRAIRVVDAMGAVLRAPETLFSAREAGGAAAEDGLLGCNVPNGPLVLALAQAVARCAAIDWRHRAPVTAVTVREHGVALSLADGTGLEAALVCAADGRGSVCREAAGIATRRWQHDQAAIVTSLQHARPHRDISTEFHRRAGPLTVVPMPGRASSLVWIDRPDEAERLAACDEDGFRAELEGHLAGLLGVVRAIAPRRSFPLSGLTAEAFGARRVALVGEAGHVFPPIGAQGLNLGLRDAAVLADVVREALARGADPGGAEALAAYDAARRGDIVSRTMAVSALGFALTSGLAPVDLGRGAGLHLLSRVPALKRALIAEGLAPRDVAPSLMQRG